MKRFILFSGRAELEIQGAAGIAGDFDSLADAFLSLIDLGNPCHWWHILDTQSGEVYERRHIRVSGGAGGMIGFHRSDWVVGTSNRPSNVVGGLNLSSSGVRADLGRSTTASVRPVEESARNPNVPDLTQALAETLAQGVGKKEDQEDQDEEQRRSA